MLRSTGRIVVKSDGDGASVSFDADVPAPRALRLLDRLVRPGLYASLERAAAGLTRALSAAMPRDGRQLVIPLTPVLDEFLEASVIGSFSRIGLSVRSRVLPESTGDERPLFAGWVALVAEPPPDSAAQRPSN